MAGSGSCVRILAEGGISRALGRNELGMMEEGEEGPGVGSADADRRCHWKGGQTSGKAQSECTVVRRVGFIPRAGRDSDKPLKGFKQRRDTLRTHIRKRSL